MRACLCALALVLAACSPEADAPEAAASDERTSHLDQLTEGPDPYFRLPGAGTRFGDRPAPARSPDEIREEMMRRAQFLGDYFRVLKSVQAEIAGQPWPVADSLVVLRRADVPDGFESGYDLKTSTDLLDQALFPAQDSPALLAAIGRHTQRLVDLGSQDGAVILRGLRRLEGTWTPADRARAAGRAASVIAQLYTERAGCVDCTTEEALAAMGPEMRRSTEDLLPRLASVHARLREIARFGG